VTGFGIGSAGTSEARKFLSWFLIGHIFSRCDSIGRWVEFESIVWRK